jgi:alpha,alpha-trehalose phosphorylase
MIRHPAFEVDPWCLRETWLDTDVLAQSESVFALSNGHVGWRGNLDEGEPHGLPGSYLNGVYEVHPLPYAEAGYGDPESGQTVLNVTNGKIIRLLVDDEPFDVRYGGLRAHERVLDFRAGTLRRSAEWCSPTGRTVRVSSVRLVSLTQRAVAAVCYEVESLDGPARIVVQSELVANEQPPATDGDPRAGTVLNTPLTCAEHKAQDGRALLVHATEASGLRFAAAMDHEIGCPSAVRQLTESSQDLGRLTVATQLQPGQRLRVVKFVTYGWSGTRAVPALRDQVEAALTEAVQTGWEGLLADQREYLDDFWARADVELDGDDEVQQAVRFGLFHVLQSSARAEGRGIPAKGLTGPGYDGHVFWDTETFVLPVLTFALPSAAADALRWRQEILPLAIERARQLGLRGAAFPWRTIGGEECSGYWPAGTAAFHINADIADAALRYMHVTGDTDFEARTGVDLLVHTARLWHSLGHFDSGGRFRIDGVTGPDEYSAVCDNNVYTNLMAQRNLAEAADAADRNFDRAAELKVTAEECTAWRRAAAAMFIPYDHNLGVHPQAEGFTDHQVWDFAGTKPDQYPLLRHFPYFDLYRKQVVKQADLVLAMQLCPDAFSAEEKARDFAYYEAVTVRDSSLSAGSQAVIAAETGHLDLAYDYLAEAALMDLADLEHNTRDGLHIASLAGSWIALVNGFGGLRNRDGTISLAPRLPPGLTRLAFTISARGRRLRAEVTPGSASYVLADDGSPIEITHHGEAVTVTTKPQSFIIGPPPAGREPRAAGRPGGRPGVARRGGSSSAARP